MTMSIAQAWLQNDIDKIDTLKRHVNIIAGQSPDSEYVNSSGDGVPFLQGKADFGDNSPVPRFFCTQPRKIARKGSILVSVRAPVGDINIADQDYCIGRGLASIESDQDIKFYYYLLSAIKPSLRALSSGSTFEAVTSGDIGSMSIPVIDNATKIRISNFLDKKTAIIDKMIAAKNHTHTHLSELRTAIITDAVRFGDAAMNAPKVRLKSVVTVYNGATPKSDTPEFWDGDIAWATPVDLSKLTGKYLELTQRKITEKGYHSCNTRLVKPGNIVISNRAPIGLVAINKIPVCTNQGCKILVLNEAKIDATYLYYYLSVITDDLQNLGTGTTFMEISSDTLKNIEIPLPSLEDQRSIAKTLDEKIMRLDNTNTILTSSLELLEEYRTSLISNVITGKVEV